MKNEILQLEKKIAEKLLQSNTTLSVAESCTGGMISAVVTSIPGASAYYLGSVTSYAIDVKVNVLGVDRAVIEENGVVSNEVALAMAKGVKKLMNSDYSVATTGLAGPGGDDKDPEGTVCIAVCGPNNSIVRKIQLNGTEKKFSSVLESPIAENKELTNNSRAENIEEFTYHSLQMLLELLVAS